MVCTPWRPCGGKVEDGAVDDDRILRAAEFDRLPEGLLQSLSRALIILREACADRLGHTGKQGHAPQNREHTQNMRPWFEA